MIGLTRTASATTAGLVRRLFSWGLKAHNRSLHVGISGILRAARGVRRVPPLLSTE
jgi:hypothetical protein